jgi:hypothetical protein
MDDNGFEINLFLSDLGRLDDEGVVSATNSNSSSEQCSSVPITSTLQLTRPCREVADRGPNPPLWFIGDTDPRSRLFGQRLIAFGVARTSHRRAGSGRPSPAFVRLCPYPSAPVTTVLERISRQKIREMDKLWSEGLKALGGPQHCAAKSVELSYRSTLSGDKRNPRQASCGLSEKIEIGKGKCSSEPQTATVRNSGSRPKPMSPSFPSAQ